MANTYPTGSAPYSTRAPIEQAADGSLTPPENIVPTVSGARAIYFTYRAEHLSRIQLCAAIEGLIAGNPPYSPADLEKHGLLHVSNFNDLDGRAIYEKAAQGYWNLLNEAEYIAKFILRGNDPQLVEWGEVIGQHFNDVVRDWVSFETQMNTMTAQLIKFGLSPVVWPDERNWQWETVQYSRFFVQDQALADMEKLTCVCLETNFTSQELFQIYEHFKNKPKDKSPWNIDELERFLVYRANTWVKPDSNLIDMMDLQRRIQNGDISWDVIFSDTIRLVTMLMKEFDGTYTRYMFDRYFNHTPEGFLYKVTGQYKCIEEALMIFTASPGEFTLHSNLGVGQKIFAPCQANMQLMCSIVDVARWASTPLIQSPANITKDFEQIRFYPGVPTNIGMAQLQQNNLGANINQLIGAAQYISSKLSSNIAMAGDDPSIPDASVGSISPSQARMQSYKEFSVLKSNVMHFYTQFDRVICNMVTKMLNSQKGWPGYKYAKEWKTRCIEDGVPEELLKGGNSEYYGIPRQFKSVKATRVAGDGSTLARIMGLQELMPISSDFGPREAKEYKREWIKATMGPEYVSVFMQNADDADNEAGGASLAGLENNTMQGGQSPIFSKDNDHYAHIAVHMALANQIIQQRTQQQMDAKDADKVFTILVPHTQEHINAISKSMFAKSFLAGIQKPWQQVEEYARLNRKNAVAEVQAQIKKQQQDQQQTQQVMTDAQRKDFVAQTDAQRKDKAQSAKEERSAQASQQRGEIMKDSVVRDADNKRLKVQLDAQSKQNAAPAPVESLPALQSELNGMVGNTPSPYDIEGA